MAVESISQILAPTNAPYINGINGEKRISAAILRALYQGLVEKDGKGVDDNYVSSSDAEEATQIVVRRVLPVKMRPRQQGASKNGASYSQNQHYVQTEEVGIDILEVLDDPILIPRASTDRINVDLLAEQIKIFGDRWATIYNGATTASKILATYLKKAKASNNEINETEISVSDTGEQVRNKFIEGNSLLDEGDQEHGIDVFPTKTRVAVFRVSYRATLKAGGVLTLGGANEAYAILKAAGVNNEGERLEDDGFVGIIDGIEVRLISNESLGHAAEFLGFPTNEFKKGGVFCGYIASSYANARGASTRERTKVVDEVNGQGIRLLPYIKFGAVCWYPLGNSFFVSDKTWNPFKDLKTIVDAASGEVTFKLKSAGSRLFPVFASTPIPTISASAFTLTSCVALDDWGTDHVENTVYVVTDEACTTLASFLKAYTTSGANKGTVSVGASTSLSGASAGQFVNVLAVSSDGSVALTSKEIPA